MFPCLIYAYKPFLELSVEQLELFRAVNPGGCQAIWLDAPFWESSFFLLLPYTEYHSKWYFVDEFDRGCYYYLRNLIEQVII